MTNFVERMQTALDADLDRRDDGDLAEWNGSEDGTSLAAVSRDTDLAFRAWGMRCGEQRMAQAVLPITVGSIVLDLDGEAFIETDHHPVEITSETDRVIVEGDSGYALGMMWPEHADEIGRILDSLGMEIRPVIHENGGNGSLVRSRCDLKAA
jgi:hypothetical protein